LFRPESGRTGRTVNRADLASTFGVSLPTVDAWVRRGAPFVERGSKGREWKFDTAAVIDWRLASAIEDALAGYQDESDAISKDEADRRRAVANAIMAEVEADEALDIVVRRPTRRRIRRPSVWF
jgi:terminase small subunit / prophage DNA-packing protein